MDRRPDETRELVADQLIALARRCLEGCPVGDPDEAPPVGDTPSTAQLLGHRRDGLTADAEHQREELMGHREFLVWHAIVHLQQPTGGTSLDGMERIARMACV